MNAIFLAHDSLVDDHAHARLCLRSGAGSALRLLARLDYRLFVLCHTHAPLRTRDMGARVHAGADRLGDLLFREHLELSGYYVSAPPDANGEGDGEGDGDGHGERSARNVFAGGGVHVARAVAGGARHGRRTRHDDNGSDEAAPTLLLRAAREHGVALAPSWMIGSTLRAIEAGNRAGCRSVLIDDGHERSWRLGSHRVPSRIAPDLYAAAVLIAHAHAQPTV